MHMGQSFIDRYLKCVDALVDCCDFTRSKEIMVISFHPVLLSVTCRSILLSRHLRNCWLACLIGRTRLPTNKSEVSHFLSVEHIWSKQGSELTVSRSAHELAPIAFRMSTRTNNSTLFSQEWRTTFQALTTRIRGTDSRINAELSSLNAQTPGAMLSA